MTSAHPPSLKAIFPGVPSFFDGHRILFGGGIMRKGGVVTMRNTLAALADADEPDAEERREALVVNSINMMMYLSCLTSTFSDSISPWGGDVLCPRKAHLRSH